MTTLAIVRGISIHFEIPSQYFAFFLIEQAAARAIPFVGIDL